MATSIFFTETKHFKLIKEKILSQDKDYLVYIYADTSNTKIPKELIRDLPLYGNNMVWVNTSGLETNQIINHMVLTIGQFMNADEELSFFIATKTQKFDKTVAFLNSHNIPVELIKPETEAVVETKRRPGRPKKTVDTVEEKTKAPRKKPTAKTPISDEPETKSEAVAKKRGRPKKQPKRGRPAKALKTRKTRIEKPITPEQIEAKLSMFPPKDPNQEIIQRKLFSIGKVKRPKYLATLSEMIEAELVIGREEAANMIRNLKSSGVLDDSGKDNRLIYND